MTYSRSQMCSIRHYLVVVQCSSQCRSERYYPLAPTTEYDVVLRANTSLEFSVVVTVQAVNHYYRHSPPSAAARFQFPPSDDVVFRTVDVNGSSTFAPDMNEYDDHLNESGFGFRGGIVDQDVNNTGAGTDYQGVNYRGAEKPESEAQEAQSSSGANTGLIVGIVILLIAVGVLAGLLLYFLKCRKEPDAYCKQPLPPVTPEGVVVVAPKSPPCPPQTKTKSSQTFDHSFYVMKFRRKTPTSCLRRDYEDRLRPNCHYAMKSEFERVPSGPTDSADDARSPQNAPLNRSQQAIPYDKNRVTLTRGRLEDRTYVNASLIRTVCHQPAIVVTQCPTDDTVGEFWKMVWDLNIGSVVMLVPCDCRRYTGPVYWPRRTEVRTVYSNIEVELVAELTRAHFVLRRFRLHGWEGECVVSRHLSQWQFLHWATLSSLPHHPVQFLDFLRDFQTKHCPDTGMLVHCILGAGVSGIFLAVDALSTDGRKTGQVDVEECAALLCLERMNIIQSFRQYRYIYYCLIELFDTRHDTCIPVSCFHFAYTNLIQRGKQSGLSHLDHEFCALSFPCYGRTVPQCSQKKPHSNRNDNNNKNNTSPRSADNDDSVWVLDGYLTSQLYVVPRHGIQFAAQFWKTLLNHNARTAVVLCPLEQSGLSIPCQGECSSVGEFLLECKKVRQNPHRTFLVYNLVIVRQDDVCGEGGGGVCRQPVRLYEFLAWPDAVELPHVGTVLDLVANMAEWCRRDGQGRSTVFHSIHSPTDESRAAIVCAIWTVLDRIHAENLVDIYMAARYVSSFVPSAFPSLVSRRIISLLFR